MVDVLLTQVREPGPHLDYASAAQRLYDSDVRYCGECHRTDAPLDMTLRLYDGMGAGHDEDTEFCSWECLARYAAAIAVNDAPGAPFIISAVPPYED